MTEESKELLKKWLETKIEEGINAKLPEEARKLGMELAEQKISEWSKKSILASQRKIAVALKQMAKAYVDGFKTMNDKLENIRAMLENAIEGSKTKPRYIE